MLERSKKTPVRLRARRDSKQGCGQEQAHQRSRRSREQRQGGNEEPRGPPVQGAILGLELRKDLIYWHF